MIARLPILFLFTLAAVLVSCGVLFGALLRDPVTGALWRRDAGGGPTNLLTNDNGDECCCPGACCHCERPLGTHCCFGLGDTGNFRFWMDAGFFDSEACTNSTAGQTVRTSYNAVDVDGDYDFVACDGGYVIWERQASQPECIPYWVFQPCDLASEYIHLTEAEEEWSLGSCMDSTITDTRPMICGGVLVCDIELVCCRPGGSSDPTETVHLWDHCCFVVNPNTCAGIGVEWWCAVCHHTGVMTWEQGCLHFGWEFTTNRVTCEWDAETAQCRKIAA